MRHSTFIRIMFARYKLRVMLAILCGLIERVSEAVWLLGRVCWRLFENSLFFASVCLRAVLFVLMLWVHLKVALSVINVHTHSEIRFRQSTYMYVLYNICSYLCMHRSSAGWSWYAHLSPAELLIYTLYSSIIETNNMQQQQPDVSCPLVVSASTQECSRNIRFM